MGNAFRFPALISQYGGAFIVIYAVALILVGFPLLHAELSCGVVKPKSGGRAYKIIISAATANSALIALYYGGIATKLASASMGYISIGTSDCPAYISFFAALAVLAAVCAVLAKGAPAMGITGKLSVCLSLALFLPLAVFGVGNLGNVSFSSAAFASGAAWSEGVGQSLLSLSLAAGVMPAFAQALPKGFSPAKTAGKIILANFLGCVIATLAILPFASYISIGGVSVAFTVFPFVICSLSSNAIIKSVLCALTFAALSVVAVHSLCSLAYPLAKILVPRCRFFPVIFGTAAVALTPLFGANGGSVLDCCDRVACCVTAVIIALAEGVYFAKTAHMCGVIGVLTRYVCPFCCIVAALISLCMARFAGFSALDLTLGGVYLAVPWAGAGFSARQCLDSIHALRDSIRN